MDTYRYADHGWPFVMNTKRQASPHWQTVLNCKGNSISDMYLLNHEHKFIKKQLVNKKVSIPFLPIKLACIFIWFVYLCFLLSCSNPHFFPYLILFMFLPCYSFHVLGFALSYSPLTFIFCYNTLDLVLTFILCYIIL